MVDASSEHIVLDKNGVARIAGSRIKVNHLVLVKRTDGSTPEEIQGNYPHLSLAQIYAAFAYYSDLQAEIDAEIERDDKLAEKLRREAGPFPIAAKLRAMGKLPPV